MARVVNPESVWTRRIRTFDREGRSLLDASGFVIEADGDHYLISNRHVLAGLTTANEYVRGRELPVEAEVTFVGNDAGRTPYVARLQLLNAANHALWLQHPTHGFNVDVVALPLPPDLPIRYLPVGPVGHWVIREEGVPHRVPVQLNVANTVFVVGFPLGMNGGSELISIWIQASVASEPIQDLHGRPRFLADGATRSGLSGAPVYAYIPAGARSPLQDPEGLSISSLNDYAAALIGVYSGRISDESDLGYVWKADLIGEIVAGRTAGTPVDDLLAPRAE